MTTKKTFSIALAVLALTGAVFAWRAATRPDCPGKIVCPLTGEIICADQCPARAKAAVGSGAPACASTDSTETADHGMSDSGAATARGASDSTKVTADGTGDAHAIPACCKKAP